MIRKKSVQIQQIEKKRFSVNTLFATRILVFVFCPEFGSLVQSFGIAVGSRVNDHVVFRFGLYFYTASFLATLLSATEVCGESEDA